MAKGCVCACVRMWTVCASVASRVHVSVSVWEQEDDTERKGCQGALC